MGEVDREQLRAIVAELRKAPRAKWGEVRARHAMNNSDWEAALRMLKQGTDKPAVAPVASVDEKSADTIADPHAGEASRKRAALLGMGAIVRDPEAIGPYHIQERIGEGGMGIVYRAEQRQPVRRMVALKVVKLGMDTADIVRRLRGRAAGAGDDEPSERCAGV